MKKIKFPSEANFFADLILQRTGPFIELGGGAVLNNWFSNGNKNGLVEFLLTNNIVDEYLHLLFRDLKPEIEELRNNISNEKFEKIVSVGPGNGLIELLILDQGLTSEILLIDIERSDEHYHGFNPKGSGYANLSMTQKFLEENIDRDVKIILCNPLREAIPEFKFTLFISLLSMGFHYPCNDYVNFITDNSESNSIVVIDKRRDVPDSGYDGLKIMFPPVFSIASKKSDRVFLSKA